MRPLYMVGLGGFADLVAAGEAGGLADCMEVAYGLN